MPKNQSPFPEGVPVSIRVDGNNVKDVAHSPRPLEIERGHKVWHDSETGRPTSKPDWAGDD